MKLNPSLKIFQPAVAAALAIVITLGISVRPAQADYIVTLEQVGSNVVATGSGTIDLTGLSLQVSPGGGAVAPGAGLNPSVPAFLMGPASPTSVDTYSSVSGPTSFGSGGEMSANSGSGDFVGISGTILVVPAHYVSGNALSDTSTYNNATFSSLGVTPGTYVWTWGPGPDQKFTLEIKFPTPTNISQCKNNGWRTLTRADGTRFENQGECIRYVETGR